MHWLWSSEQRTCPSCSRLISSPSDALVLLVLVQSLSPAWLYDPTCCSTPASLSFTICQRRFRLMSTESVMPSSRLILCGPLLIPSVFPSTRVFFIESALRIRWPKYWSFSLSISPSNEYSGLISFRINCLDLLAVPRVFSNTIVQKHQFFSTQPS